MSFECFKEFPKEKVREMTIERDPHYKIYLDYKRDSDSTFFEVFIKFVAILFLFYVPVFGHKADGILAPSPGIKPATPALEGEVLTTGPPGKSP